MPSTIISLRKSFNAREPHSFLSKNYPVIVSIPPNVEPEFGVLMNSFHELIKIDLTLRDQKDSNLFFLDNGKPDDYYLVSLTMDTVNEGGIPTQILRRNSYEGRRRFGILSSGESNSWHDLSFKSAGKGPGRTEHERNTVGLDDFAPDLINELVDASGRKIFSEITDDKLCLAGNIINSRHITFFYLVTEDACFKVESNNDDGILVDHRSMFHTGERIEKEFEVKTINLRDGVDTSPENVTRLLEEALAELTERVLNLSSDFKYSSQSKGGHASEATARLHESSYGVADGYEHVLAQQKKPIIYNNSDTIQFVLDRIKDKNLPTPIQIAEAQQRLAKPNLRLA